MQSLTVAGFLAVLGLASATRAQDEVIPLDRVPKAVMNAAKAKFPGAKIQKATEETEDGKPIFSLDMKHQRHNVDVSFKENGTVVLVETAVPQKELPKPVLRAAARRYPGASLSHAGAVRTGPELKKTTDYYELYLLNAEKRPRLIKVDPKGEVLEDPFQRVRPTQRRPTLSHSRSPVAR